MNQVTYSQLTIKELELFGASFPRLSEYSIKASVNNEIIGYIALENNPLTLKNSSKDEIEIRRYKQMFNSHPTYYLRKIAITPEYRYTGVLEDMFREITRNLPDFFIIWCRQSIWDLNGYVKQLGGFSPMPYGIRSVLLFTIDA